MLENDLREKLGLLNLLNKLLFANNDKKKLGDFIYFARNEFTDG